MFHLYITDYALHFPTEGVKDYVNIWGMPSLAQVTVCLWMKSNDTGSGRSPFSYAVPGTDNELLIFSVASLQIFIGGDSRYSFPKKVGLCNKIEVFDKLNLR